MSPALASLLGLFLFCAATAGASVGESSSRLERGVFLAASLAILVAIMRETGRLEAAAEKTRFDRGFEVAAFVCFLAHFAYLACRLLVLR